MSDKLLAELQKVAGKDYDITYADDEDASFYVDEWISTGCLALDAAMGGGLPMGRIIEIYGDSSTGKSLIAEQIAATAQEQGGTVLYMDTERAVSIDMLQAVGVDASTLIYAEPETVQQTFELMETFLTMKDVDTTGIIIWDSIAATTEKAESEKGYEDHTIGTHARAMSKGLRKLNGLIKKNNASAVFVNQTRKKIGVMFGDDTTTFGGKALEFYSSIRLQLSKGPKIKSTEKGKGKHVIGITNKGKITKNKVAVPFKTLELPIYFGHGIDDAAATLAFIKEYYPDRIIPGQWSKYILDGGELVKFQAKSWYDKVFDPYYEDIEELLLP